MLPGKTYTPEEVLSILRRRIWLFLIPFALVSASTAIVTSRLPNTYRSEAMIMVMPQGVTDVYVMPAVTRRIEERLPAITQQILSRTRLEPIIEQFNLYPEARAGGITEEIIERMRDDINISPARANAFRVSYIGSDPQTVLNVTERLASSLIAENVMSRSTLAEGTSQFLDAQLEEARRRLIDHEQKLEGYRRNNATELPSQVTSNLQVMQNTQMQIQRVVEAANRDRDRRMMVQRQIDDLRADMDAAVATAPDQSQGSGTAQELAAAKVTLAGLEQRFTANHPEIGSLKRRIRDLEAKAAAEAAPQTSTGTPRPTPAQKRLAELQAEVAWLDRQIASRQSEEARLSAEVAAYQRRVDMAPTRESEMVELTRDYATLQTIYASLLTKKEESDVAADLEKRQIGEQLQLIDPARLPEQPASPNRQRYNVLGLLAGLAIGAGLLTLMEYLDGTFRTDDELSRVLALPVLAVVPVMASAAERRRSRARTLAVNFGLGSTVVMCLAVVAYSFVS
jgi:polysaccharide chain length determinant protein (PEP-CTERM system associated)